MATLTEGLFGELGLDAPFAEGSHERESFEGDLEWGAMGEGPFAEAPSGDEISDMEDSENEELSWLDVGESATDAMSMFEDESEDSPVGGESFESDYLDDEERDASEWYEDYGIAELPTSEAEDATQNTPVLSAQQRAWILALDRSAIERLSDATLRTTFLQQDWSTFEFPGNGTGGKPASASLKRQWALGRSLFDAMAKATPERRVPTSVRFRDRPVVRVPGQPDHRLYGEARDAFIRMRDAASADGVRLFIRSSWRSRAQQARASAHQSNPAAVARKLSTHMYGLAIDLQMSVSGLPVAETNTRIRAYKAAKVGTEPLMGNLVRMYRSPVYKWMALRAAAFGWYPYRNEPWHWEYNPPGLKERFENDTNAEAETYFAGETSPSVLLTTFTPRALGLKVAVYVTQAAKTSLQVELLLFAHGLDVCQPASKGQPAAFITGAPFHLGKLVEASGRPVVLVVPFLDWEHLEANHQAYGRKWHRLAKPEILNAVLAEAMEQARALIGSTAMPALQRLILAGHSRAFGFFDALAHEHASPQMSNGALGKPTIVWALDTTYSAPIADWHAWLKSRDDLSATVIYRQGTYRTKGSDVPRQLTTGARGKEFAKLAATSNGRLTTTAVAAEKVSHCAIPSTYLPRLLAALPASNDEAEAEALELEARDHERGECSECGARHERENEEKEKDYETDESTDRFDSFEDQRDAEWGSESSEESTPFDEIDEASAFLVPEDETGGPGLAGSGLTPSERKAVEITSLFETGKRGGFYGLSGNFDGQGLSFGLVNWTIGTGSLQPLLRDFARENPDRWQLAFGTDAGRFQALIMREGAAAQKEQHRFAIEQMNIVSTGAHGRRIWTVRQPWVGYFRRLSEDPAFQKIQVRYVRDLLATADRYCRQFRLTSEQGLAFMFDTVSSHGKRWIRKKFGGVEKRRVLLERALKELGVRYGARIPEHEVLLAIADVLGTTSAQRWADKVRRRKRWFVTGQHPRARELEGLRPRADLAYSTSGGTAREV